MTDTPAISVGLPVRNGARYVGETLASLLGQSVANLELIISDNASTDGTEHICRQVAKEDGRVRYIRQNKNIGGPANWNFVFQRARGPLFKWASANDLCEPRFLEKCRDAMLEDPEIVLAYPRTLFIDADGKITGAHDRDFDLMDPEPWRRFDRWVRRGDLNNAQQGLIRTAALRSTRLERDYESGDLPLMAELALLGKWKLVEEHLLLRRMTPEAHVLDRPVKERRRTYYVASQGAYLPFLRPHLGEWRVACTSSLSVRRKLSLFQSLLRILRWRRRMALDDLKGVLTGRAMGKVDAI